MKIIVYIFLIYAGLISCKKHTAQPSDTGNSIYDRPTGLDTTGLNDTTDIVYVEDIDTFLLPLFEREYTPHTWTINVPPPRLQLYNSCVGWAIGYGLLGYQYGILEGWPHYNYLDSMFSPAYIWNQLNGGRDKGISLDSGMNLIKTQGCCKWTYMPENTSSFTIQPTNLARDNAQTYKLTEAYKFKTVNVDLIKAFLAENYPIPFGAWVDKGFESQNPMSFEKKADGRKVWNNKVGGRKGGHAMLLCGYDDDISAFKVLNSWGTDWGNEGYIWIDYNFFNEVIIKNIFGRPQLYLGVTRRFGSVTDVDGNKYKTLKIGTQEWMVENLRTTHYRNSEPIPNVIDSVEWLNLSTGAFCNYNNDGNYSKDNGHLYNWYAVNDSRGISPHGWHIPSQAEWEILINYLGGRAVAGGKMKALNLWEGPNVGANNSSGFTGLPSGKRGYHFGQQYNIYIFVEFSTASYYWTSTQMTSSSAAFFALSTNNSEFGGPGNDIMGVGSSVRCIKD